MIHIRDVHSGQVGAPGVMVKVYVFPENMSEERHVVNHSNQGISILVLACILIFV